MMLPRHSYAQRDIQVEVSAPRYLYFSWFSKYSANTSVNAKIMMLEQVPQESYRTMTGQMYEELLESHAVSLQETERERARMLNNQLDVLNTRDNFSRSQTIGDMFDLNQGYAAGGEVDLSELLKVNQTMWNTECKLFGRQIQNAKNSLDFWTKRYKRTNSLRESKAVSLEETLWTYQELQKALARKKAVESKSGVCDADHPSHRFLTDIKRETDQNDKMLRAKSANEPTGSSSAQESEQPQAGVQTSPPAYMTFYDFMRSVRIARDVAGIEQEKAKINAQRLQKQVARRRVMLDSSAVSQREYRLWDSRYKRQLAQIKVEKAFHDFFAASVDVNKVQMQFAAGEVASLEEMYAYYNDFWDADCDLKSSLVERNEAELEYLKWLVIINSSLRESKAISEQEYQRSKQNFEMVLVRIKELKKSYRDCRKDLPKLSFLQSLMPETSENESHDGGEEVSAPQESDDLRVSVNAPTYLLFHFLAHQQRYGLADAKGELEGIKTTTKVQKRLFEMSTRLLSQKAVSLVEYRRQENRFLTSQWLEKKRTIQLEKASANYAKFELQTSWAAGKKPVLKDLYNLYRISYDRECEAQAIDIENAKTQLSFRKFLRDMSLGLVNSSAVSQEEYENDEANYQLWKVELEGRQAMYAICKSDIPTFDEISKIKSYIPEDH